MNDIIGWITTNWGKIIEIYFAVVTVASIIVRLTPDLKDDTVLLAITKFVGKYIALNRNAPTERPN